MFGSHVCAEMHTRAVEPAKEWFTGFRLALYEVNRRGGSLIVDCLHTLLGERAAILDLPVGIGVNHATRAETLLEFWILRIGPLFRFLLSIEVVKVAKEFVEAVGGREVFVTVAKMILAKLSRCVA